ncbi:three-helix bundle dimerization domain-containing protein [Geodermatophilus sp. URMC 64]
MTSVVPTAADPSVDISVDSAVARLAEEFSDTLRPQLIVRVVRQSRRDLGGSPVGAMPELVERLARYRLQESIN